MSHPSSRHLLFALWLAFGCSSGTTPTASSTGGSPGTGGTTVSPTGGAVSPSGGATSPAGGAVGSGGAVATGGATPTGGTVTTDFLKLKPSSALVDKGVDVGLPYQGTAPDLGAFECK